MFIKQLTLKNIGPFSQASLSFPIDVIDKKRPITIITGMNGTGKSIVIDAIRAVLKGVHGIERDIIADKDDFSIQLTLETVDKGNKIIKSGQLYENKKFFTKDEFFKYFSKAQNAPLKPDWVIDYWNSSLGSGSFTITNLSSVDIRCALEGALDGVMSNVELIKFICSMDYLRSSDDEKEREVGESVYNLLKSIINRCLVEGEFKSVLRKSLSPIVTVNGKDLTLEKLSSGNILLIERFVDLIRRMYSICELNNWPISKIQTIPGVLLIDEIENHLHPRWQKSVLNIIQEFFPNLQIILTTHSPFVVSSVKNATVYVCKSNGDGAVIVDETSDYSNLPVDEVLNTPVFDVGPFSDEITNLLKKRKVALQNGEIEEVKKYTEELVGLNREYFTFYKKGDEVIFFDNEAH